MCHLSVFPKENKDTGKELWEDFAVQVHTVESSSLPCLCTPFGDNYLHIYTVSYPKHFEKSKHELQLLLLERLQKQA